MSKELLKRTVFGLLFGITIILSVLYYKEGFYGVFFVLLVLGMWEFYAIAKRSGARPLRFLGLLTGVTIFSAGYRYSFFNDSFWIYFIVLEIFLILTVETFRHSKTTVINISTVLAGLLYVAIPITVIQYLFFREYNPYLVLSIFFIIWANDSGAYVIGSLFGKHKLAKSISPKKTWEGAIGGSVVSMLLPMFLPQSFLPFELIDRFTLTLVVVIFSTLGDLFQSKLKRSVNIKDSGNILPGHGGILDRIDSMLFAFPAVFVYLGILGYETF